MFPLGVSALPIDFYSAEVFLLSFHTPAKCSQYAEVFSLDIYIWARCSPLPKIFTLSISTLLKCSAWGEAFTLAVPSLIRCQGTLNLLKSFLLLVTLRQGSPTLLKWSHFGEVFIVTVFNLR